MSEIVQSIIERNAYMTLATADEPGMPWATPVWYATADCREFIWVSSPSARHSRNLSVRSDIAIVIFDSRQRPYTSEGLYISARAEQVTDHELDRCLEIFCDGSRRQGLPTWSREEVQPPARLRLYHAQAVEHYVLSSTDERIAVTLEDLDG